MVSPIGAPPPGPGAGPTLAPATPTAPTPAAPTAPSSPAAGTTPVAPPAAPTVAPPAPTVITRPDTVPTSAPRAIQVKTAGWVAAALTAAAVGSVFWAHNSGRKTAEQEAAHAGQVVGRIENAINTQMPPAVTLHGSFSIDATGRYQVTLDSGSSITDATGAVQAINNETNVEVVYQAPGAARVKEVKVHIQMPDGTVTTYTAASWEKDPKDPTETSVNFKFKR